jgi:hypothetical protein
MIDFSKSLMDYEGRPLSADVNSEEHLTLGAASIRALVVNYDDERNLSPQDKFKRGELAHRIHNATTLELKSDEITLIKNLIGKAYGPLVIFRAWPLLDAAETPKVEKV